MALGRNLFIFGNHFLYRVAHALFSVQPEHAYLIFKYGVVAQAPLAVIAAWVLARDFSRSLYTATLASLFMVFSPVFVLYGGQVMTDVPSVLVLCVALIVHYRGVQQERVWLVLAGAALLGLGVNLRETIGFYAPWLVVAPFVFGWKFKRRQILIVALSCLVFLLFAVGWFAFWFITDEHYRFIWHRVARIDATGNRAASGYDSQPSSLFCLLLCQRAANFDFTTIRILERVAS